jgi:hypothetical protein
MHFTAKRYLKLPNYTVYHTNHPAGTAIIIKNSIKHHQLHNYSHDFLQATSVSVEDSVGLITISAVYLPPKHTVKQEQLEDIYNNLGHRFIAGGDYNAKHTDWGSRLITPIGTVSTSNIENIERFQSKALRMVVDTPWYVPNTVIRKDPQIPTVKKEIHCYSSQYSARLSAHPNDLTELLDNR